MAINDTIHDAITLRQVELIRAANGEAADIVQGVMRDADDKLLARLAIIEDPGRLTPRQLATLELRMRNVLSVQERRMRKRLNAYLGELSAIEAEAMAELFDRVFDPLGIKPRSVTSAAALAAARRAPINGVPFARTLQRFFRNDRERVLATLRDGAARNLSTPAIGRAIVGSVGQRRLDGIRNVTRRGLATVVQTVTTHAAAQAREAFTSANVNLIKEERWVSTLDGRTSATCQDLDGLRFLVGRGQMPPAHPNCRSARMPIVPGLQALDVEGKGILPATVAEQFDGKGPQVLTYPEWLASQSTRLQREVLGPTRFALWQTGEIELRGFVNDRGVRRTLEELRLRIPQVFDMAGLTRGQ